MGTRMHVRKVAENGAEITDKLAPQLDDYHAMADTITTCVVLVSCAVVLYLLAKSFHEFSA